MFASNSSFALEWARMEALGRSCSAEDDAENMVRYANTAQTVEDLIAIIERHGEWRHNLLVQDSSVLDPSSGGPLDQDVRSVYQPGDEKMQYWGSSWGSLLGQTFATVHPDRVARIVIDGIVDPDDYYHNVWLKSLQDSDKVMTQLCEYCFEAGPAKCPMFTGSSALDIQTLVEELILNLKLSPIIASGVESGLAEPVIVDFDDYYLRAINAMAFPFSAAEDFFRLMAELRKGNVTEVAISKQTQVDVAASLAGCRTLRGGCLSEKFFGLLGTNPAVECLDSAAFHKHSVTKDDFWNYFATLSQQSQWFSPSWARHRMSCMGMTAKPAWPFTGQIGANTSSPMLIIGNTRDTVTPLENARRVSSLFPGSSVLQQDSEGHCSHASPSSCTARHVRHYFQTGQLPEPATVCEPDWRPLIGEITRNVADNAAEENILRKATVEIAQGRHVYPL